MWNLSIVVPLNYSVGGGLFWLPVARNKGIFIGNISKQLRNFYKIQKFLIVSVPTNFRSFFSNIEQLYARSGFLIRVRIILLDNGIWKRITLIFSLEFFFPPTFDGESFSSSIRCKIFRLSPAKTICSIRSAYEVRVRVCT